MNGHAVQIIDDNSLPGTHEALRSVELWQKYPELRLTPTEPTVQQTESL